jgi:hypothetical protein
MRSTVDRRKGFGSPFGAFLPELNQREQLNWSDGSFAPAKKGARKSESQVRQGHEVDGGGRRRGCWESSFTLLPRAKSSSRKKRSRRSA